MRIVMRLSAAKKHKGLSLVELLIAMTIGLILLGGVFQIALKNNENYRMHEAMSRVQESGRFAMDIISKEIRMADFWGCARSVSQVYNLLDPSGVGYANYTFDGGLSGTDGSGSDPDTITLSGAFGTGIQVETPYMTTHSAALHVTSNNGLAQSDIVLVSDCLMGDIFQITNANPNTSGTLVHNTGSGTNPGNYNPAACSGGGSAHCLSKTYEGDAQIYHLKTVTFAIADSAFSEPTLTRSADGQTAVEVVSGIENMQFTYGEDITGDGVVDIYRNATNVANWEAVINVKISLLVRSPERVLNMSQTYQFEGATYTPSDGKLRRVFTNVVTLRNRAL